MYLKMITVLLLLCNSSLYAQDNKTSPPTPKQQIPAGSGTLKLYPNPAKTYTNIYVDWNTAQAFKIIIYDMQFNTQLSEIPVAVRKNYQYALDVSKLPEGKYKITVISVANTLEEILTVKK